MQAFCSGQGHSQIFLMVVADCFEKCNVSINTETYNLLEFQLKNPNQTTKANKLNKTNQKPSMSFPATVFMVFCSLYKIH